MVTNSVRGASSVYTDKNIIFLIYDKDVFGDIKINSCEFFLALQGNSHDNIGKDKDSWKTVFPLVGLWSLDA
ncbi:unnamed protein product [Rhizophagus irregularis]|nr:unnamed protein product [Rhizophagus irregularis]